MSPDPQNDSPNVRFIPPLMLALCLAGGLGLQFLYPLFLWSHNMYGIGCGSFLIMFGSIVMIVGWGQFKKMGTTVKTTESAKTFVTFGIYRYIRNPMYLGMLSILLGLSYLLVNAWMLLGALAFYLYCALYAIPAEEAYMKRRFGKSFESYCQKTRRWL